MSLVTDGDNIECVIRFAASVATSVTYGRRVESVDEWIVRENMAAMDCEQYLSSRFSCD